MKKTKLYDENGISTTPLQVYSYTQTRYNFTPSLGIKVPLPLIIVIVLSYFLSVLTTWSVMYCCDIQEHPLTSYLNITISPSYSYSLSLFPNLLKFNATSFWHWWPPFINRILIKCLFALDNLGLSIQFPLFSGKRYALHKIIIY